MNKIKLSMLAVVAASSIVSAASAEGMYVSVGGGVAAPAKKQYVWSNTETEGADTTVGTLTYKQGTRGFVQGEVGYSLGDFRLGAELFFMPTESTFHALVKENEDVVIDETAKARSISGFVNGYYDIKGLSDTFEPYVTAGLGLSNSKIKDGGKSKNRFAYKVGLGTRVNLSDAMALDFAYKYTDLGAIKQDSLKFKRNFHAFSAAVVYKF